MRAIVVSDAHLSGLADPGQAALVRWLDALELDELIVLGDLFHHWWGWRGAVMTEYVPTCAALLRLRERGVPLHFVPGNHDFAAGPFFTDALGARVTGPVVRELGGRRFLLAHGDEADARAGYRLTRAFLRGPAFAAIMRAAGPERGRALMARLAGQSREHMGGQGPLVAAQRAWAQARLGAEADVVVMGHVHWPEVADVPGGTVVHLGDWVAHRTFLLVEDGALSLRQYQGGDPLGAPWAPTGS